MAERTEIAWCDSTFNPWIGCTKVGPGCDNCYAELLDKNRFSLTLGRVVNGQRQQQIHWGPGAARHRTKSWGNPGKWNKRDFVQCPDCGWRADHDEFMQQDADGLRSCCSVCGNQSYIAARRRVFCASLADVFDNEVSREWRLELFNLIEQTPNLDWLLLTKRIGNAARMMEDVGHPYPAATLPHVSIGASIVNQEEADRDIPKLLATPAAVRFLSMEPLLGPVEFSNVTRRSDCVSVLGKPAMAGIDWVIVGGESGPNARPMHPDWARSLRDQCAAAGVPFLFKQWGEWLPSEIDCTQALAEDGSGRELPSTNFAVHTFEGAQQMARVGKKAAGRLLDGVEHNGFPEVARA